MRFKENIGSPLNRLKEKEAIKLSNYKAVVAEVQLFIDNEHSIWRVAQVCEAVNNKHGVMVKPTFVANILRLQFGMRYRKIKRTAYLANSPRSLVVRHEFAKCMIKLLDEGYTILNVDETFLNVADLRYMRWRVQGETNSMRERAIDPLLKVFAGISTLGDIYMAVS